MARSQCRPFLRHKKSGHVGPFQFQQLHFSFDPSGVPGQTSACADNAVAGNDDRYFVVSDGAADGLRGHPRKTRRPGQLPRDLAVGRGLPVGDLQKNCPYGLAERRADGVQRRQKVRFFAGKVYVQPAPSLGKGVRFLLDAFFRQIAGKVLLTVKPQARRPISSAASRMRPIGES